MIKYANLTDTIFISIAGTTELDTVERLELKENKWRKCCRLPLARSNAGVCTLNNNIYCIGGWNGQTGIKQCDVYRSVEDKWDSICPLNTGRYQAGVNAYQEKLWVAGGSDAWTCLNSVETYDPEIDKWSISSTLLTPRRGCGLAVFNGKLYAVGGSDGTHSLSSTEIFDDNLKTWIQGPSLTTPRANVSVVAVAGKLYAIGGFSGKCFLNTIEYLDANTNEWSTFVQHDSSFRIEETPEHQPELETVTTNSYVINGVHATDVEKTDILENIAHSESKSNNESEYSGKKNQCKVLKQY